MGSLILIPTVVDPTLRKKREGWGTRRFVVHAKDGRLGLCGALGLPRVLQGSVSGPPHVVAADLCGVDANADVNGMTVRLMAATFLNFCCGIATRARRTSET